MAFWLLIRYIPGGGGGGQLCDGSKWVVRKDICVVFGQRLECDVRVRNAKDGPGFVLLLRYGRCGGR